MKKNLLKQKTKLILAFFMILLSSTPNSFAQTEEIQNPNKIVTDDISIYATDIDYDPGTSYDWSELSLISLSYESLVRIDPKNSNDFIGLLATNWIISSDGKTYTFTLRKDVSYHDGKPFNAYTMKYSLDRLMIINDPTGPAYLLQEYLVGASQLITTLDVNVTQANTYLNAKGINVINDYTLEIKLVRPNSFLLNILYEFCKAVSPYSVISNMPANYSTNQADDIWGMVSLSTMFPGLTDWTKLGLEPNHDPAISGIVPQSGQYGESKHVWMSNNMIGTGPYKLDHSNKDQIQFVKNNNWAGTFAINAADELIWNYEPNIETVDFHFRSGSTDFLHITTTHTELVPSYIDVSTGKSIVEGVDAYIQPLPTVWTFAFNLNESIANKYITPEQDIEKTWNETHIINDHVIRYKNNSTYLASINNPFTSLKFRKAFSMAVDYDSLIAESFYNVLARRAEGIIPYGISGHQDQLIEKGFVPTFDLTKSKQFFQEVGWRGNITLYDLGTPKGYLHIFNLLVQSAISSMNIGIKVNVENITSNVFISELNYFPLQFRSWGDDYPDPLNSIYIYYYSKTGYARIIHYTNPEVDLLINQLKAESDYNKKIDIISQIEEVATSDYAYIYTVNRENLILTRSWIHNIKESGSLDPFSYIKFQYISKDKPNTTIITTTTPTTTSTPNFDVIVLLIVFIPLALMKLKKKR